MHFQPSVIFVTIVLLSAINLAFSLKTNAHRQDTATLREAVNNAFDALTEVQQAIPKYKDVFEEEAINLGDIDMDKNTAEKFVQEIDQLEDMILNKENDLEDRKRKGESIKKDKSEIITPEKRNKEMFVKEMTDPQKDKKHVEKSFDKLLDILKKGVHERNREMKFQDFLMSNFEKDNKMMSKNKKELKTDDKKDEQVKRKIEALVKKSNISHHPRKDENNCGGSKKECGSSKVEEKKEIVEVKAQAEKKDMKKHVHIQDNIVKSVLLTKKNVKANSNAALQPHHKPPGKKQHPSSDYDREIKDLVDIILRKREDTKREKLKLALADVFQILDRKRTTIH